MVLWGFVFINLALFYFYVIKEKLYIHKTAKNWFFIIPGFFQLSLFFKLEESFFVQLQVAHETLVAL